MHTTKKKEEEACCYTTQQEERIRRQEEGYFVLRQPVDKREHKGNTRYKRKKKGVACGCDKVYRENKTIKDCLETFSNTRTTTNNEKDGLITRS